jgi:hypothetical protein
MIRHKRCRMDCNINIDNMVKIVSRKKSEAVEYRREMIGQATIERAIDGGGMVKW